MDQPLTQEESYAERRKLFKNIWETSMHVDEKDDFMNKPKIIKTLRLEEMDRNTAGKKKRQRIKNLRAVCNKLLDFCDRQDADDLFYEQMVAQGKEPPTHLPEPQVKKKQIRKKIKKAKSMLSSTNVTTTARVTISEMKDVPKGSNKINKYSSSNKIKRTLTSAATRKSMKPIYKLSKEMPSKNSEVGTKKIVKKKMYKKAELKPIQQGTKIRFKLNCAICKESAIPTKRLLQMNKIVIK